MVKWLVFRNTCLSFILLFLMTRYFKNGGFKPRKKLQGKREIRKNKNKFKMGNYPKLLKIKVMCLFS